MSIKSNDNKSKVRPKSYADSSFIVFFAIMELRGINRFKAQHLFLLTHQEKVSSLCSKVSLIGRPYPVAINNWHRVLNSLLCISVIYVYRWTHRPLEMLSMKTKVSIKHEGVCGIKGTEKWTISPKRLRALDTDASWSTSRYCGWVYGYGLHLTTTANGFPRLADVWTASVSEKADLTIGLRHYRLGILDIS